MKAIVITAYGGPEVLSVAELPDPVPGAGEVLIRVRAFGLNHAETYMRSGAWGTVAQVTGIECAGTVQADPNGRLAAGTPVIAILGGMGRTRNGSYAELVTVPAGNVVPVSTALPWTDLVALPEVYATAWAGLHQNLGLRPGQTVLVRGATSALGQAAVNIAAEDGVSVIATTRSAGRADLLRGIGAASVLIDDGALADQVVRLNLRVDGVFDLVGNSALRDFLDIFNQRLILLLYRVHEMHHPELTAGSPDEALTANHLYAFFGLGRDPDSAARSRLWVPDRALLHYSGLLAHRPHSASGLERLLADYFQVDVAMPRNLIEHMIKKMQTG